MKKINQPAPSITSALPTGIAAKKTANTRPRVASGKDRNDWWRRRTISAFANSDKHARGE